jgi:acyl-CoA synthetase (NDP forming)
MSADAAKYPLGPLFDPDTIAVVGASNNVQKFGGRPIRYMLEGGYQGAIYPVNPKGGEIQGLTAYADIRETPRPVDMAVIAVPAVAVLDSLKACEEAGVKSAIVFASGYAEMGNEGTTLQNELVEFAEQARMRIVGPNCLGSYNGHSRAIGTFSSAFEHGWPKAGNISIVTQSGAVGVHTMVLARERGLGVRYVATTGNEIDVDVADCIAHCVDDPLTTVIATYVEGTKKPQALIDAFEAARQAGKPVTMLKVGASEVGTMAANSHTASLAGDDAVYEAIFRQHGVYRAQSLEELLDVASAGAAGHFPTGKRLGIVTISGGAGVLAADAASKHGLEVPALPQLAQDEFKELVPFASVRNPVDTTAEVLNNMPLLEAGLDALLEHGEIDATLLFLSTVGFSPRMMGDLRERLPRLAAKYPDALMLLSMVCRPEDRERLEEHRYLVFEDPNRAINALAALVMFGNSFARSAEAAPPDLPAAAAAAPGGRLGEAEALSHLAAAGVPVMPHRLVRDADDAVVAAAEFGFPAVMKVASADIAHKSDVGGVKIGLPDADAVRRAYDEISRNTAAAVPDAEIDGMLMAPMISGGVECIVGVHSDPVFGPMVMFGLGGVLVEVLKDVAFRAAPFGLDEAHRMIREIKGFPVLEGVRGQPPADINALAETLCRLSVYAAAHRDAIDSIDINPLVVHADGRGAMALDGLIITKSSAA